MCIGSPVAQSTRLGPPRGGVFRLNLPRGKLRGQDALPVRWRQALIVPGLAGPCTEGFGPISIGPKSERGRHPASPVVMGPALRPPPHYRESSDCRTNPRSQTGHFGQGDPPPLRRAKLSGRLAPPQPRLSPWQAPDVTRSRRERSCHPPVVRGRWMAASDRFLRDLGLPGLSAGERVTRSPSSPSRRREA